MDKQLLYNVARMYYLEGKKQEEIASIIKRSRSSISMFLTQAREAGIVEIKLRNPLGNNEALASRLIEKYSLERCFVVPTSIRDSNLLLKLAAERAIEIFNEELLPGLNIGIAWGRTCYEFMTQYYNDENTYIDLNIVPLIGGSNRAHKRFQINEMVRDFAEKLNATPNFIHAPAMAESLEDLQLYKNSSMMKKIVQYWDTLDIAVTSIGVPPSDTTDEIWRKYLDLEDDKSPVFNNAVGDICGWPFDKDGNFLSGDATELLMVCSHEQLKKIPKVFCIVAGLEKAKAVSAGLKSRIFSHLIIDEQTALAVLNN